MRTARRKREADRARAKGIEDWLRYCTSSEFVVTANSVSELFDKPESPFLPRTVFIPDPDSGSYGR